MAYEAKVWVFGVIGVLFFLAGIANAIDFTTGIVLAIIFWIIAGFFSKCKKPTRKEPVKKKPVRKKKTRRKRRR